MNSDSNNQRQQADHGHRIRRVESEMQEIRHSTAMLSESVNSLNSDVKLLTTSVSMLQSSVKEVLAGHEKMYDLVTDGRSQIERIAATSGTTSTKSVVTMFIGVGSLLLAAVGVTFTYTNLVISPMAKATDLNTNAIRAIESSRVDVDRLTRAKDEVRNELLTIIRDQGQRLFRLETWQVEGREYNP